MQLTPPGSEASIIIGTGVTAAAPGTVEGRVPGPAPERADCGSFAAFSDPDGNGWLLQEVKQRPQDVEED